MTTAKAPDGTVRILAWQAVLTASIAHVEQHHPNPDAPRFPVAIDIGFNMQLLLQSQHLSKWAGWRLEQLPWAGEFQVCGRRVPVHAANVWLYPNVAGSNE